jgi:hypothetical protein
MANFHRDVLDCKNRDSTHGLHVIRIPFPKLFGRPPTEAAARDTLAVDIACPECMHVYGYTRRDIHLHLFQTPDQDTVPPEPVSFVAQFLCDVPDCRSLVSVHTMRGEHESRADVLARLRQSVFHTTCLRDHMVHFPADPRLVLRAEDDGPFAPF